MRTNANGTTARTWGRRAGTLAAATGIAAGTVLLGASPALAADTTKVVAADGSAITFAGSDSSRGVSGGATLVVGADGNWALTGTAHNSHLLVRTFHWTCTVSWDASSVTVRTNDKAVPGKKTRTGSASAYDPNLQAGFATIADHGTADCDIVIG